MEAVTFLSLCVSLTAMELIPGEVSRAELKDAVESQHGGKATFVQAVLVHERHNGETVWDGLVHIFDIKNHSNGAWRAYACSYERDDSPCEIFTVLHSPKIDGPRKAVAVAIVGKHRTRK